MFRYMLQRFCLVICIIGANLSAQSQSVEIPGNTDKPYVMEEMLLLNPKLQGEFTGNYIWPSVSNNLDHEIGVGIDYSSIYSLTLLGNTTFANHATGLSLTGFSGGEKSDITDTLGNGNVWRKIKSDFSFQAKTFLDPFLPGFVDGISAECYYSKSKSKLIIDTTSDSSGIDYLHIQSRGIYQIKKRFIMYVDGWFNKKDSAVSSVSADGIHLYNPDYLNNPDAVRHNNLGYQIGLIHVLPNRSVWRISYFYEHNTVKYSDFGVWTNRLGVDGLFLGQKKFGSLTQYTGFQTSVYFQTDPRASYADAIILYKGLDKHIGCAATIPFLLQYCPISPITFLASCKISFDIKHFLEKDTYGNTISSAIEFTPFAVQWTPSKHHSITFVPMFLSTGILNAFLEWRFTF